MFAGYDSFCGLPVIVGSDSMTATARKDPAGNKYIHIDPGAMANWTISRIFTLAHECAHHRLGHTNSLGEAERFAGGTARQELEADCWAAKKLRSNGYDSEVQRMVFESYQQGHFSGGVGYPSGVERARNIASCADGATEVRRPSCRNIEVREPYMDVRIVMQPVQTPCPHCGCNYFGQCGCVHQFDVVQKPVQVPVQSSRVLTKRVCE